jgi:acyl-CoA synthetase (AMP-forming)/AMP-acid ligase II
MPVPGVQMRLVNDQGEDVADGEVGEIWLRSDCMFAGYWQNPEAEAAALADGWLRTGDLARRDEDGFYHFCGRIKELIIRGGSNISPVEVENVLDDFPGVEMCGVVGFADEHWGEVVGAFVEPVAGATISEDELREFAAKRLARYMIPEHWVFVDKLPRNAVGKLDRHALHELAATRVKS